MKPEQALPAHITLNFLLLIFKNIPAAPLVSAPCSNFGSCPESKEREREASVIDSTKTP